MGELNSCDILLIDDDEDIRDVLSIVLSDAGYSVSTAQNGDDALKLLKCLTPHIIITDVQMPGISGLELLESVKKNYPDIEVVVVTAFGEMDLAVKALQLDASDFITKPVDEKVLFIAIERAEARYNSRKQLRNYTNLLEKENVKTARELVKNYSYQKNLIESSIDGILAIDEKGLIVTCNKSMEKIVNYERDDLLKKLHFEKLLDEGEKKRFYSELSKAKYGGKDKLLLYETTLITKSNNYIPVQISATLLLENGIKCGIVCFIRDLRGVRKLERELSDQASILHQDKMMSLGRLSASVVHEINNPLFGVLNYVRLMIRVLKRGEPTKEQIEKFSGYLDLVEKETRRCTGITSGLLTFARKSESLFEAVKIDELLNRCVLLSQHKLELSNIKLVSRVEKELPTIDGDLNQLQQCIINLIFNAVDAMPNGGNLELNAMGDPSGKIIKIVVKDSGEGINKKDISHIFEPFFTTKKEGFGVGLGLSTVQEIIVHHKGDVKVKSKQGEGTSFTIHLPVNGGHLP
jgi:PAS domain S-box-containing protein